MPLRIPKLWASILDRQDFADQFLKQSSTHPQLLFACAKDGKFCEWFGLYGIRRLNGMKTKVMVSVICNPSTGQSFTLPRMNTRNKMGEIRSFFGHDPVEKQFKVLSMTWSHCNPICEEHQVLTLETGKLSCRMIKCNVSHYPKFDHGCNSVCINGVLYYKAKPNVYSTSEEVMIICFDVRFEKFSFIKAAKPFMGATLMNYKGKLASLTPGGSYFFGRENTSFEMWVLDDREKEEWSKHSYKLPPQWQTAVTNSNIILVGVAGSNEIVFSGHSPSNHPFYVFYYSLEKGTIRRVKIQGIGEFQKSRIYTFLNHVKHVKLMKGVLGLYD
ncbi:hypothetical protein Bca101_024538 [Brassica carinata]